MQLFAKRFLLCCEVLVVAVLVALAFPHEARATTTCNNLPHGATVDAYCSNPSNDICSIAIGSYCAHYEFSPGDYHCLSGECSGGN